MCSNRISWNESVISLQVINEMKETTFSPEYFRHRWLATPASFSDGAGWREKVTNARLESNTREQGQRAKPEDKDHEC